MRVLLVEDDEIKRKRISEFLKTLSSMIDIQDARSLQSGLRAVISQYFDMIILDMSLPNYDITADEPGGEHLTLAGREMLRQMQRRKLFVPVVVLTAFDYFGQGDDYLTINQIRDEMKQKFSDNYKGAVYYQATTENWKHELIALMSELPISKKI
jgi:CheY-like chemotaxis protein